MQFVFAILSVFVAIGVWSYRLQMAKRGLDETRKMAEAIRNKPRKYRFQNKAGRQGIDSIDDPREAAAVMMMEVARGAGEVTAEHKAVMQAEIVRTFEISEDEATELVTASGWLGRDESAPHVVMHKMTRLILQTPSLGPNQFVDLSNMLDEVALIEGGPTPEQVALIRIFREDAGIRV